MDIVDAAAECFPASYADARRRFRAAAATLGAEARAYPHPLRGPEGEDLAIDVAWIGPADASAVLVLVSATHGVEGFCGTGGQMDWLAGGWRGGGPDALPKGTAACLIHGLNCHGYAWLRRVTEEGVDLNRNFLDFTAPLPENPGYAELHDALVPRDLAPATLKKAEAAIAAYARAHGEAAARVARAGGQYSHATGLFYGGREPTWANRTLARIHGDFAFAERRVVAVLDYHTGLGPYGYGEPICRHAPGGPGVKRARAWWGPSVTEPALGTSASAATHGLSKHAWERVLGDRVSFVTLEYGTYPQPAGTTVLRADHWLHAYGAVDWAGEETRRIKRAIRDHFFPDRLDWKEMVLARSRQLIRQALDGMAAG